MTQNNTGRLDNLTTALQAIADSTGAPEMTSLLEGRASETIEGNPRHAARLGAIVISEDCTTEEYCRLSAILDPAAAAYGLSF